MTPRRAIHVVTPTEPPPTSSAEKKSDVERVEAFLRRLVESRYFGKVTLSFQSGRVTDIRIEQAMKVDDL